MQNTKDNIEYGQNVHMPISHDVLAVADIAANEENQRLVKLGKEHRVYRKEMLHKFIRMGIIAYYNGVENIPLKELEWKPYANDIMAKKTRRKIKIKHKKHDSIPDGSI